MFYSKRDERRAMIQANLWQALKIYLITVGGEESFVFDVIVMDYYNGCKDVNTLAWLLALNSD